MVVTSFLSFFLFTLSKLDKFKIGELEVSREKLGTSLADSKESFKRSPINIRGARGFDFVFDEVSRKGYYTEKRRIEDEG